MNETRQEMAGNREPQLLRGDKAQRWPSSLRVYWQLVGLGERNKSAGKEDQVHWKGCATRVLKLVTTLLNLITFDFQIQYYWQLLKHKIIIRIIPILTSTAFFLPGSSFRVACGCWWWRKAWWWNSSMEVGFNVSIRPKLLIMEDGVQMDGLTLIASSCFKNDMERPNHLRSIHLWERWSLWMVLIFQLQAYRNDFMCHLEVWWLLLVKEVTFRWCC